MLALPTSGAAKVYIPRKHSVKSMWGTLYASLEHQREHTRVRCVVKGMKVMDLLLLTQKHRDLLRGG